MSNVSKVLFVDILTSNPRFRKIIDTTIHKGGYAEVMRRAFGIAKQNWQVVDPIFETLPNKLTDQDAVVIGGSLHNIVKGEITEWMSNTMGWIRSVSKQKIPMLGICGGMQFIAYALGAEVKINPRGRELGSVELFLTTAGQQDPLFDSIKSPFKMLASHQYMVDGLKRDWQLLAYSHQCAVQAIAIQPNIRLVQFHPEMSDQDMRGIVNFGKKRLFKEGFVSDEAQFRNVIDSIEDTSSLGKKIIKNFMTKFVQRSNKIS